VRVLSQIFQISGRSSEWFESDNYWRTAMYAEVDAYCASIPAVAAKAFSIPSNFTMSAIA
jgi:hypothetical protein